MAGYGAGKRILVHKMLFTTRSPDRQNGRPTKHSSFGHSLIILEEYNHALRVAGTIPFE